MRFILDKWTSLLLVLVLAIQEMQWVGWDVSPVLVLIGCTSGMGLLFLCEKKQWNVFMIIVGSFLVLMAIALYRGTDTLSAEFIMPALCALQCMILARLIEYLRFKIGISIILVGIAVVLAFWGEDINRFLWIMSLYLFIASISEMLH